MWELSPKTLPLHEILVVVADDLKALKPVVEVAKRRKRRTKTTLGQNKTYVVMLFDFVQELMVN